MATGYRALPAEVRHPRLSARVSAKEFEGRTKSKVTEGPSLYPGHAGTEIWYCNPGYVVRVKFESGPDALIESASTFTPTMGMDMIDGFFAEDAEEWLLEQKLNRKTDRLRVFGSAESIPMQTYLDARGLGTLQQSAPKKWWEFWR